MILLSLFIVVLLERTINTSPIWHHTYYIKRYNAFFTQYFDFKADARKHVLIWLTIPVLLTLFVQSLFSKGMIGLALSIMVLFICLGCSAHRAIYKAYLEAANRGDAVACEHHADRLGLLRDEHGQPQELLGQTLIWLNYKFYLAVIFWFALLGPTGAVLYVFSRSFAAESAQSVNESNVAADEQDNELKTTLFSEQIHAYASKLITILDFIPVRIAGFAYLFVGNFSQALPYWLKHLADTHISAREYVTSVAAQAEDIDAPEDDCTTEPCTYVKLAKRAVLFCIALIAVLSILGVVG